MQQELTQYAFDGRKVRVLAGVNSEALFVLADLCAVLGLSSPHKVAERISDDARSLAPVIDSMGRVQQATVVTEAGMYEVVIRSDSPAAKPFQRWVTHEVLPAIRKHGGYLTPEATEAALSDPDFIIQLATSLKDERAKRAELEGQAKRDRPKVLFADAVATSDTTILVGDLAKILRGNGVDIGANRLFERLREDGYLIKRKGSDWNMPTQYAMDLGLFKVKETAVTHSDGHVTVSKTPKITGKGQAFFVNKYAGRDLVA